MLNFHIQTELKNPKFEVEIALDRQTMTLYTPDEDGNYVVLIFDNYTLKKFSEFTAKKKKRSKTWKRYAKRHKTGQYIKFSDLKRVYIQKF